ncbi:MAG: endolytic transglycosylase MltG [Betaproteobacteria bacterium]|nr:endolytic transglycosylase MltG [Betaproteobacteria bacterium]
MRKSNSGRGLILWVLLLLGPAVWLAYFAYRPLDLPAEPVEFAVKSGQSTRMVARQLEAAAILPRQYEFLALAILLNKTGQIKAGQYSFKAPLTPMALLEKLTRGDTVLSKLTVVEGWSFRQMREAVNKNPDLRHEGAELNDAALLAAIGAPERWPEGLFFPDTYYFDAGSSDIKLYRRAYHAMRDRLGEAWPQRADGLPYKTPYEALVMASIIEKETGAPEERPQIAAVFVNRLRLGMRLQTDPTVIYGMGERFDGNLRKGDLSTDTPYNTYTRAGLPPTPIALPGEAAIRAALKPDTSRALYFVAMGEGKHHFSASLDEHNRAVNRYQRKGR